MPRADIPDSFADAVVELLTPGVHQCIGGGRNPGGSPEKRQKTEGQA